MFHVEECILYRDFTQGDILKDMIAALSLCCQHLKNQRLFFTVV